MPTLDLIRNKVKPYLDDGKRHEAINRLFRFDECFAFKGVEDRGFALVQKVAYFFDVPIRAIHLVGSAQIGYSLIKGKDFSPGASDLDIAIVDTSMFLKYSELCYRETDKYRNMTGFSAHGMLEAPEVAKRFGQYLSKGYLRPDYMPNCKEKRDWMLFFERLGDDYLDIFKKITCGIYLSDAFFSSKQEDVIDEIARII